MALFINLLISALAVFISAYILPGVHVNSFFTAVVVAVVLGIVNVFIKPIFIILTLPITIFSLGLFYFVINALMILLVARIVPGFQVDGFWWALIFALVLSLVGSFLNSLTK